MVDLFAVWCVLFVVVLIWELATLDLVTIWFMPGVAIAALLAYLKQPVWLQIAVFFVMSLLALVLSFLWAKRRQREKAVQTNADRVIGEIGVVTAPISIRQMGQVKVLGQIWSAQSAVPGLEIEKGVPVEVLDIQGAHLIVSEQK